ncbi:hypothetical protein ACVDG5_002175 [Mesorhizobium sp. ORM6]
MVRQPFLHAVILDGAVGGGRYHHATLRPPGLRIGLDGLAQHPLDGPAGGRLVGQGSRGETAFIGLIKSHRLAAHDGQGVASGMACTTLSIGNAIGMATLIAVANGHMAGLTGDALKTAIADGVELAFWLAAAGIAISLLAAMLLPGKAR